MDEQKLNHPVLDEVYAALEVIEQIEAMQRQAKEALYAAIALLPEKIGNNKDLKEAVFQHLYWNDERVPALALRQAFQVKNNAEIGKLMKVAYLEITCVKCNQPFQVEVTSRSDLKTHQGWAEHEWGATCQICKAEKEAKTDQWYEQWQAEKQARLNQLRTMLYREYLQTPEWQERRKRAMKRAGFRCQVCNAHGVRLNVHHRTYERRGNEDDRDLIVLCQECHAIFHENGSLANVEEG